MEKRNYTHVQALLSEIKAMLAEVKTPLRSFITRNVKLDIGQHSVI